MKKENHKSNPMLFHQPKGLLDILSIIKLSLQRETPWIVIQKIIKNIYYKILGVDFTFQSLDGLTIQSENKNAGTLCGSSNESTVKNLLDILVKFDPTITNGTFVDIGSGKGKLIVYAKQYGFKQCVGIEYAYELYQISLSNIKKLNIKDIEVQHLDATDYQLDKDTRVIYFLNPFDASVFDQVLPRFIEQMKQLHQDIYLVYRVPFYKDSFTKYKEIEHITTNLFRGDLSEIYKFSSLR